MNRPDFVQLPKRTTTRDFVHSPQPFKHAPRTNIDKPEMWCARMTVRVSGRGRIVLGNIDPDTFVKVWQGKENLIQCAPAALFAASARPLNLGEFLIACEVVIEVFRPVAALAYAVLIVEALEDAVMM